MRKKCTVCQEEKDYENFYLDKRTSTGRYSRCKKCHDKIVAISPYELQKARYRTVDGKLTQLYQLIIVKTKYWIDKKREGFEPIIYSKDEFKRYFLKNTNFEEVFKKWEESEYSFRHTPTVDRINNKKGYYIDNIQCLSFIKNRIKKNDDFGYITRVFE